MQSLCKNVKINSGEYILEFTELKKRLNEGFTAQIFYIEGSDAYFREKSIEYITEKFIKESQMNVTVFDGSEALSDPEKLFSAINMYPFMSEKRLVIVKDFYPKADYIKKHLAPYAENPLNETILAIVNSQSADGIKKLNGVTHVNCNKADKQIIVKYITATCSREGVEISTYTAELICEYCLQDMTKIVGEVQKLISYAFDKKVITDKDVENLCYKDTEYQIYQMTDCVARKNFDQALGIIKELLGKGEPPQKLFVSLYTYFRRMLSVSISTLENSELSKLLSVQEYAIKKTKEQAKLFKKKALKKAVDLLSEYDYMSKTGKITFQDALDTAVFRLMAL